MFLSLIIIILIIYFYLDSKKEENNDPKEDALEILRRRYAQGDISQEEFLQKKEDLLR
ncbi:MAG: SHOCT domain-containing protein [Sphaerochaetaceae bacterium]|jgi:uncharacterized membrane protein